MNRILGCAGLVAFLALSLSINAQDQTPPPPAEEALPQAPPRNTRKTCHMRTLAGLRTMESLPPMVIFSAQAQRTFSALAAASHSTFTRMLLSRAR